MHIHYISEQNSILNHFLAQIRDVNIQNDSMRFRKNIERIGEIMAYELSKTLDYKNIYVNKLPNNKIEILISKKFHIYK